MSYRNKDTNLLNKQELRLNEELEICRKVMEVLNMPGWKDTLEPILDKMIIDIVGGKIKGYWTGGKLNKAKSEEKREFYIGCKQALIEFHQRALNHVRQYDIIKKQLAEIQKQKKVEYKMPMTDTKYSL